jgi:hypothetical protein
MEMTSVYVCEHAMLINKIQYAGNSRERDRKTYILKKLREPNAQITISSGSMVK